MKFTVLLLTLTPLMFAGCSAVGRAVGAATHVLSTGVGAVTRPLSGTGLLADPGAETGWEESIGQLKKEDQKEDAKVSP